MAGAKGWASRSKEPRRRSVLVFDHRTYQLLGENDRVPQGKPHAGALTGGSADLESAILDSLSARP